MFSGDIEAAPEVNWKWSLENGKSGQNQIYPESFLPSPGICQKRVGWKGLWGSPDGDAAVDKGLFPMSDPVLQTCQNLYQKHTALTPMITNGHPLLGKGILTDHQQGNFEMKSSAREGRCQLRGAQMPWSPLIALILSSPVGYTEEGFRAPPPIGYFTST